MSADKTLSTSVGTIARTPSEIADDLTLTNAHKIELIKSFKEHHAGPGDKSAQRDADRELEKLLDLNPPANRN